jgi:undecaprenyl-diphosphatase
VNAADSEEGARATASAAERPAPGVALGTGLWDAWHRLEMQVVGAQRRLAGHRPFCMVADAANWLGNGWLYLILALSLLVFGSRNEYLVLLQAALAAGAAHAVYPWIKRKIGRLRPFERMPNWHPHIPVLDRYSFPSGHCMTATAVAIPLALAYPQWLWAIVAAGLTIAWARMACAHHYPSDLVAGCALGATMAYGSIELLQKVPVL